MSAAGVISIALAKTGFVLLCTVPSEMLAPGIDDLIEMRWSAWTTSAGRRFEVRKFESGNKIRTTSPRRQFIVGSHFRSIPVLGKRSETAPQIGGLRRVDPTFTKIHRLCWMNPRHDDARTFGLRQRLQ